MFKDEESIVFKRMHDFSTADGFVEISENLADMIKFVANEPSVGLFYVQQHTQKAVPNLITLKKNVVDKSHETALHTEDLEDSITMIGSMKECGFPIANDMIGEIKKSLAIVTTKQPKRGLLHGSSSGFLGRTASWSPSTWGRNAADSPVDVEKNSGYLSSVLKSAKQRAGNFKWPQIEQKEVNRSQGENTPSSTAMEAETEGEAEDLPLSGQTGDELQQASQLGKSSSHQELVSLYDNYDEFKADKEANFSEWLDGVERERKSHAEGP